MKSSKGGGRRGRCRQAVLASLAVTGLTTVQARAAEFDFGFGYVGERSDNVSRTPSGERSDWVNTLLAGAAYRENTPELLASVVGQAQTSRYRNDTFDDTSRNFLDAAAVWTISPGALTWTAEDHYTQVKREATAADTPDSLIDTNAFETGPDWYLRLGGTSTLVIGGRYGQVYFSEGEANNDRVSGHSRWLHGMDSTTTLSLNVELLDVDYEQDSAINVDYRRIETFLRYDSRQARSRYVLDFGKSRIEHDRATDVDGSLARLMWTRELTPQSRFGLGAAREHGDTGTQLLDTIADPAAPTDPTTPSADDVATPDIYYVKRAEMFYNYSGADFGWGLQLFQRDFDYQRTPQDREEVGGYAELVHNPMGTWTTTLYIDAIDTQHLDLVREDEDRTYGARVRYQATRNVSVALEGGRIERDSTNNAAEFTERRFLFGLYYSSGPQYMPGRR